LTDGALATTLEAAPRLRVSMARAASVLSCRLVGGGHGCSAFWNRDVPFYGS
jgi:hypothetical protein